MLSDKELNILYSCTIDLQSFLLLKGGEQPVIRICQDEKFINSQNYDQLKRLCQAFGIKMFCARMNEAQGLRHNRMAVIYLSLDPELAKEAYSIELSNNRKKLGKIFGYPECCIDGYIKSSMSGPETDHNRPALNNTKGIASFLCNNIFNYISRISSGRLSEIFSQNYLIFNQTKDLFLINHVPCLYNCSESITIGKKTLELLKKENKVFTKRIISALKRPVLYFDIFSWLVFSGSVSGDTLRYKLILPYRSMVPDDLVDKIARGDKLKCGDKNITVYKDNKVIYNILKQDSQNGIIINFE